MAAVRIARVLTRFFVLATAWNVNLGAAPFRPSVAPTPLQSDGAAVRLVVVLNVDSMIPEQLERLNPWWTGGFRRLLDYGTVFVQAELPYAHTEAAPGHASFATGCLPRTHGITGDALVQADSGRQVSCVLDEDTRTVSSYDWRIEDGSSASAGRMECGGWAEVLRAKWPASRSVSISGKGSSAILLAGKQPDLALWWDSYGRGFVSSSAYCASLPEWVSEWNATWPESARGWSWETHLPGDPNLTQTAADARRGEESIGGRDPVFPYPALELPEELLPVHQASLAGRVYLTPQMDRMVLDLAQASVAQGWGADDDVDLLALSLSACDVLASATGPYSLEVTEALLAADRELGGFFTFLDERVGAERWTVVLSSDHGLLELPEGHAGDPPGAVRLRVRARRQALQLLRQTLEDQFGQSFGVNLTVPADGVIFSPEALAAAEVEPAELRRSAARTLATLPWVAAAYTREELTAMAAAEPDPWRTLAQNSYRADRGVDVEVRLAHRHLMGIQTGTRSGSPYRYDRRQPLIFMGPGFSAQRREGRASSVDALPTVSARLGLARQGGWDGRDLFDPAGTQR